MTFFNYTEDLPVDPKEVKSGFYRLPRSILLPPYLATNPYFVEYTDAIDQAFDGVVDSKLHALENIRNMWTVSKGAEVKISNGEMLDFAQWAGPDRSTLIQQVNMLGMELTAADAIDEVGYRRLAKFLGSYWFDKGKNSTVDFLNFCLGTNLVITPLWTRDYVTFSPYPGDDAPFIYDAGRQSIQDFLPKAEHSTVGGWGATGGVGQSLVQVVAATPQTDVSDPWFPTTHVHIEVPPESKVSAGALGKLFYEICNYNLVLYSISTSIPATTTAEIIAVNGATNTSMSFSAPAYQLLGHHSLVGTAHGVGVKLTQPSF